jgi:hypothetical protein
MSLGRRVKVETFIASTTPYLEDFYEAFTAKIAVARGNIYVSGEGFDCSSADGKQHALSMATAIRHALRREVRVVRLQTLVNIDPIWLDYLIELLNEYPRAFELYAIKDPKSYQMASACAIDAESTDHSTAEFMLQLRRYFGSGTRGVAGTAVLVDGHQLLAEAIRDQILRAATDEQYATRIKSPEHARTFFRGEHYFAYGSNMCRDQMMTRCPTAISEEPAVLMDHRLVFNRRGSYRPGGVAGVEQCPGERVYGLIWRVSEDEFENLDKAEDPEAYRRERITVHTLTGKTVDCHVYRSMSGEAFEPDIAYLRELAECAEQARLPKEYVHALHLKAAEAASASSLPAVEATGAQPRVGEERRPA